MASNWAVPALSLREGTNIFWNDGLCKVDGSSAKLWTLHTKMKPLVHFADMEGTNVVHHRLLATIENSCNNLEIDSSILSWLSRWWKGTWKWSLWWSNEALSREDIWDSEYEDPRFLVFVTRWWRVGWSSRSNHFSSIGRFSLRRQRSQMLVWVWVLWRWRNSWPYRGPNSDPAID
jgi:hypothetical protein